MGSMTQGVTAGIAAYQRGKHLELLRENQERQAMLGGIETLNKILGMPKNLRGPMLDQYGEDIARMTGKRISATLIDTFKKADEEQAGTLREVFSQAGLEMDPQKMMGLMGDPYKALDFAMKVQKGKQASASAAKRASIMGVGGQAESGGSAPEIPDTQLRTGPSGVDLGMPASPPPVQAAPPPMAAAAPPPAAAPAQDDDQAEVARLNSVEDAALVQIDKLMTLGEGISEGEKRGFDAKLHAIEKRRSAILNSPGITADLAGPNGEPLVVLHTKNGAVKTILGRKPPNLDFIDGVDPKDGSPAKLAVDKNTGKTAVIGKLPPKEPGTIEERLAVAERFAQANPQDPRAQANLAQAQRGVAIKRELIGEQAEATARGTKRAALETPERPNQSVIEKFADLDAGIGSARNLLVGSKDKEIQEVLGMSPQAIALRRSGKVTGQFLTKKQIDYMAELANTTGELRRILVGQAQTSPEMKNLEPLIPKSNDPLKVQIGKIEAIQRGMENHRVKLAKGLKSVNILVPGEAGEVDQATGDVSRATDELSKANKLHIDTLNNWLKKKK